VKQRTDEEIAEEEVGGVDVCAFSLDDWSLIDRLNLSTEILQAIEQAPPGLERTAVELLLEPYGITPARPDG